MMSRRLGRKRGLLSRSLGSFSPGERLEGVVGSLGVRIVEQRRGLRVDCR